jgi:hypothetical protein
VGNLTPLECLVEAVELREDEFAVAVVLGVCGLEAAGVRLHELWDVTVRTHELCGRTCAKRDDEPI